MEQQYEVEKAVKMSGEHGDVLIVLWRDKHLSICSFGGGDGVCYTTSRASKSNEQLYYIAQAWYYSLGFKRVERIL